MRLGVHKPTSQILMAKQLVIFPANYISAKIDIFTLTDYIFHVLRELLFTTAYIF